MCLFRRPALVLVFAASACATAPDRPVSADDPANPEAAPAPIPRVATSLDPSPTALEAVPEAPPSPKSEVPPRGRPVPVPDHMGATTESAGVSSARPDAGHGEHGKAPAPKPAPGKATGKATGHEGHGGRAAPELYTCPMHPEVISKTPGTCPKCGMKLVPKKDADAGHGAHP